MGGDGNIIIAYVNRLVVRHKFPTVHLSLSN